MMSNFSALYLTDEYNIKSDYHPVFVYEQWSFSYCNSESGPIVK